MAESQREKVWKMLDKDPSLRTMDLMAKAAVSKPTAIIHRRSWLVAHPEQADALAETAVDDGAEPAEVKPATHAEPPATRPKDDKVPSGKFHETFPPAKEDAPGPSKEVIKEAESRTVYLKVF